MIPAAPALKSESVPGSGTELGSVLARAGSADNIKAIAGPTASITGRPLAKRQ